MIEPAAVRLRDRRRLFRRPPRGVAGLVEALRRTLFKYRLHQERELFDRAYGYIRQYY